MQDKSSRLDQTQQEVSEIAEMLLKEHPPGTPIAAVWEEALMLHRVRYETEILPPPERDKHRGPK